MGEGGDDPRCALRGAGGAEALDHAVVTIEHLAALRGIVREVCEGLGDALAGETSAEKLGDDGLADDEVDERDVGHAEEMVEDVVGQPSAAHGVADDLRHTEERGLERSCARGDERHVSVGEQLVGAIEDDLRQRVPPAEATSVVVHRQPGRTGHYRAKRGETARHVEHGRQILRDLVPSAAGQDGQQRPTVVRHGRNAGHGAASEVLHGVYRRVADVIDGIV